MYGNCHQANTHTEFPRLRAYTCTERSEPSHIVLHFDWQFNLQCRCLYLFTLKCNLLQVTVFDMTYLYVLTLCTPVFMFFFSFFFFFFFFRICMYRYNTLQVELAIVSYTSLITSIQFLQLSSVQILALCITVYYSGLYMYVFKLSQDDFSPVYVIIC